MTEILGQNTHLDTENSDWETDLVTEISEEVTEIVTKCQKGHTWQ